jgi:phosphoribosyl 1,2-cyclic phosphodiesterase
MERRRMKVKIWGCRGSIPSPGAATVRHGGDTTCIEIRGSDGHIIIIDAGSGMRKLGDALMKDPAASSMTLILTHAHWDHLMGFPFFRPLYVSKYSMSLCGGPDAQQALLNYLKHQMDPPYFPVDYSAIKADIHTGCRCDQRLCLHSPAGAGASIRCDSIPLSHPNGGYGFKLTENGRSFVFLTDNELKFHHEGGRSRDEYRQFCTHADLLIHDAHYLESEYDKRKGWGHSTIQDAVELALDAGARRLGLYHHDPDRTDAELDVQVGLCREYILSKGSPLECFACADGMELIV